MDSIKSVLKLNKLVFDRIEFIRQGFKNENQTEYRIEAHFAKNHDENIYRVTLILNGEKKEEFVFTIKLTGYFSFEEVTTLDEDTKNELISKNAVAILMPYMRSQVSLLTAQPEVDCIVLPPFNINNIIKEENAVKKQEQ